MARRKRSAVELVSDIGALGFDLQFHSDEQIAAAVIILREVNPELFNWLVKALQPLPDTAGMIRTKDDASARVDEEKQAATDRNYRVQQNGDK